MNRIKVWLYAVIVVVAGVLALRAHTARLRARALGELDARLAAAAAQVGAATRALAREASAGAVLAARDAALVQALHAKEAPPPEPAAPAPRGKGKRAGAAQPPAPASEEAQESALRDAARAALASAEKAFGFDLPAATVVTAGNREWLARKGEGSPTEGEAMTYLRAAIAGNAQRGWVRLNGSAFYAAAAPAGEGAGLVVLVPVDELWLRTLAASGADVTLSVPGVKAITTARAVDAQALAPWTMGGGTAVGIGTAAKVELTVGPMKLPPLPAVFGAVPVQRARAVAFEGVKNGFVVVSLPAAAALAPILSMEWEVFLALALVLLAGLVLGLFVRVSEAPVAVPEALLAAATRIERGDFAARAPALAGKFGTLATALNRAAELAGPAAAAATARASATDEFFARGLEPKPAAAPPAPSAPAPAEAPGPFAAAAAPPRPAPAAAAAAPPAPAQDLLQQAARAASPAAVEVDEESHWQQVFQDFLRTRASCGEASEGLTYDRFRVKLESNKATLVAKYACKTVKFQVYVKDGKAALKATPVK